MKINNIDVQSCVFCASDNLTIIASISIKEDMQINNWYMACEDCKARGSKMETKQDAIAMWNRDKEYFERKNEQTLF